MRNLRVLYISENTVVGSVGRDLVVKMFNQVEVHLWSRGEPLEPNILNWAGDWIISFKSDFIVPKRTLAAARKGCINFHPAPSKYRGVGGYGLALKNGDKVFGVTVHEMVEKVDFGRIIEKIDFPISENESVESLKIRTGIFALLSLNNMLSRIDDVATIESFPTLPINWSRKLYTYKDLNLIYDVP